jgi:hypothetical protein
MKEIKVDMNKQKHSLGFRIKRVNIIKMFILPKVICKFSAICIKILMAFFTEVKRYPKIFVDPQKSPIGKKIILSKKEQSQKPRSTTLPNFKIYYSAMKISMALV